ncbi:TRAP transporter small permease [Leucothrix sargassi]|nr:TRAP transporter small permease [Leucothrix sargassi]
MSTINTPSNKSVYDKLLDVIAALSTLVAGICLVVMTVIFSWLVYGRYVLNETPTWVEQVSLLLVVFMGFLGAATGVHRRTHLSVNFFRYVSPRPVRRFFELLTHLIMGGFAFIMMWKSYELAVFKWGSAIPLIDIPEGVRAIPIVLCGAFTMLYSLGHIIRYFQGEEESPVIASED